MTERLHRVFCYGTLKRGRGNSRLLEGSTYVGEGSTLPAFTMIDLGSYPGVIKKGDTSIQGELYEVDDKTLARLDRLEGHPNYYYRIPIRVGVDGNEVEAEIYVLPESYLQFERSNKVEGGVW